MASRGARNVRLSRIVVDGMSVTQRTEYINDLGLLVVSTPIMWAAYAPVVAFLDGAWSPLPGPASYVVTGRYRKLSKAIEAHVWVTWVSDVVEPGDWVKVTLPPGAAPVSAEMRDVRESVTATKAAVPGFTTIGMMDRIVSATEDYMACYIEEYGAGQMTCVHLSGTYPVS